MRFRQLQPHKSAYLLHILGWSPTRILRSGRRHTHRHPHYNHCCLDTQHTKHRLVIRYKTVFRLHIHRCQRHRMLDKTRPRIDSQKSSAQSPSTRHPTQILPTQRRPHRGGYLRQPPLSAGSHTTHLGHALAQRRLTIIISSTSDTTAFIANHETNRRIPTTAGIVGRVTTHADLIHALTVRTAAITVVLASRNDCHRYQPHTPASLHRSPHYLQGHTPHTRQRRIGHWLPRNRHHYGTSHTRVGHCARYKTLPHRNRHCCPTRNECRLQCHR